MCTTLLKNKDQKNKVLELLSQIRVVMNDSDKNQGNPIEPMIVENVDNPQKKASTKRKTVEKIIQM